MELRMLADLTRRSWRLLVVMAVLGLAAGGVWISSRTTYTASTSVLVSGTNDVQSQQLLDEPARYIKTLTRVATSGPVLADASTRLGGAVSVRALKGRLDVQGGDASNVMDLSVTAATASEADREVTAVTSSFLEAAGGAGTLLERGDAIASGSVWRPLALGTGAGLVLGGLLALAWTGLRRPLLSAERVTALAAGTASVLPYCVPVSEGRRPGADVERLAYDLLRQCRGGGAVLVTGVAAAPPAHALFEGLQTVLSERLPPALEAPTPALETAAGRTVPASADGNADARPPHLGSLHLTEVAPVTTSALVNLLGMSAMHLLLVAELGRTTEAALEAALSRVSSSPAAVTVVMVTS